MFGLDSFASHEFAGIEITGEFNLRNISVSVTLDGVTIIQDHVLTPSDLLQSVSLNSITGFESNEFTNRFDELLVAVTARREFLVTITTFKLRSENPTTT